VVNGVASQPQNAGCGARTARDELRGDILDLHYLIGRDLSSWLE
jgi:hypothetical protein